MKTFCPFFRDVCRGNECVMFRNGACLFVSYLEIDSEDVPSIEESLEIYGGIETQREVEVPDWIKTRTAEELAVELLEFRRKEFSEDEDLGFHTAARFFWESKGIESYHMPSDIQLRIERAEILARKEIRRQSVTQKRERFEKEKAELPSLVSQCVDWARAHGLKRLTLADVDAYILERNFDILKETRRAIYAKGNVELKSGK